MWNTFGNCITGFSKTSFLTILRFVRPISPKCDGKMLEQIKSLRFTIGNRGVLARVNEPPNRSYNHIGVLGTDYARGMQLYGSYFFWRTSNTLVNFPSISTDAWANWPGCTCELAVPFVTKLAQWLQTINCEDKDLSNTKISHQSSQQSVKEFIELYRILFRDLVSHAG